MAPVDSRTSRILFTVLLFALGLYFVYSVRHTLVAFLFAIFFAYLMDPLVSRLQKVLRGRTRAIALIYVVLLSLAAWLLLSVGPRIAQQANNTSQIARGRSSDSWTAAKEAIVKNNKYA